MILYWPKLLFSTIVFYSFSFLVFLFIGWYCGAGIFGLIGCASLSLSRALPTFFNINNNNNRLDLVITDAPDIVDVFVGTRLGTSYH